MLHATERERDRNVGESQANAVKIDFAQSELELRQKEIANVMGQLNEARTKFSHQQQQFLALAAERDTLRKSLETVSADRDCVRQKLRVSFNARWSKNFRVKFYIIVIRLASVRRICVCVMFVHSFFSLLSCRCCHVSYRLVLADGNH